MVKTGKTPQKSSNSNTNKSMGLRTFALYFGVAFLFILFSNSASAISSGDIVLPEEYADGRHCPPPPEGHISYCGRIRTGRVIKSPLAAGNSQTTVEYVRGATAVTYEGSGTGTGKVGGGIPSAYALGESNEDGEYWTIARANTGLGGQNYLAFFCDEELAELIKVPTNAEDTIYLPDITVDCKTQVHPDLEPPDPLIYTDRTVFVACTDEIDPFTIDVNAIVGTFVSLICPGCETSYIGATDYGIPQNSTPDPSDDIPPAAVAPARDGIEGRDDAAKRKSTQSIRAAIGSVIGNLYGRASTVKQGQGEPDLKPCSDLYNDTAFISDGSGSNMHITANYGSRLTFLEQEVEYNKLPAAMITQIPVCEKDNGSIAYLSDFQPPWRTGMLWGDSGPYEFPPQIFPYWKLYEELPNEVYATLQETEATNDSYDSDPRDIDFPTDRGDKPFRSYNESMSPGDQTGTFQERAANKSMTQTLSDENPVGAAIHFPFTPYGNDPEEGINPDLQFDNREVGGTFGRIGIIEGLCTCTVEDMEDGVCDAPQNDFVIEGNAVETTHEWAGGYKVTADASPSDTFFGDIISNILNWISQAITAIFNVFFGNWLSDFNGPNECVPANTSTVGFCNTATNDFCSKSCYDEQLMESCPSAICDGSETYPFTCTYTETLPGPYECAADLTYDLDVEEETFSQPDRDLAYGAMEAALPLSMPYEPLPNYQSIYESDFRATKEQNPDDMQGFGAEQALEGGAPASAMWRMLQTFYVAFPVFQSNVDLNKPIVLQDLPPGTLTLGECDGEAYEAISGTPPSPTPEAQSYFSSFILADLTPEVMSAYAYAEGQTGVPCEIMAGIHFIEAGNSPDQSPLNGSSISPSQLNDHMVLAATILLAKVGKTPGQAFDNFAEVINAMSYYNGGGNGQCQWIGWPTVNGLPLTNWSAGCPPSSTGMDDPYATNWMDGSHVNMSLIYILDFTKSDEFCANICPADPTKYPLMCGTYCPNPIPFLRPGALTVAEMVHQNLSGL